MKDAGGIDPRPADINHLEAKLTSQLQQRDAHFQRAFELAVKHYGLAPAKTAGERTRFKQLKNLPAWNAAAGRTVTWTAPKLWTQGRPETRIEEGRLRAAGRFLREGKEEFRGLRVRNFNDWRKRFRRGVVYGDELGQDIVGRTLPDGTVLINLAWLVRQEENGNFVLTPNMLAATIFHELVHFEQLIDPSTAELTKQQFEFRAHQAGIAASTVLGLSAAEAQWVKSGLAAGTADDSEGFHRAAGPGAQPPVKPVAASPAAAYGPAVGTSPAAGPADDCSRGPGWAQADCAARRQLGENLRRAAQVPQAAAAAAPAAAPAPAFSAAPPRRVRLGRPPSSVAAPAPRTNTDGPRPPPRQRCYYQGDWCR